MGALVAATAYPAEVELGVTGGIARMGSKNGEADGVRGLLRVPVVGQVAGRDMAGSLLATVAASTKGEVALMLETSLLR